MITPTYTTETKFLQNYRLIAGVDEVGRAPLAGPVVSAVVILDPKKIGRYRSKTKWWSGVRDSKTLRPRKRESISEFIKDNAIDFAIGIASHTEIDEFNIHYASLLSMKRAVQNLKIIPEIVLVDGNFEIPFDVAQGINQHTIVDGDAKILSIAAASIIAKVFRDDLMRKYADEFCDYGFEKHKGYPTALHQQRLIAQGPCAIHRMSFETVKAAITKRFARSLDLATGRMTGRKMLE